MFAIVHVYIHTKRTRDIAVGEQSVPLRLHIFDGFGGLHLKDTPVSNMVFLHKQKNNSYLLSSKCTIGSEKDPFYRAFFFAGVTKMHFRQRHVFLRTFQRALLRLDPNAAHRLSSQISSVK